MAEHQGCPIDGQGPLNFNPNQNVFGPKPIQNQTIDLT